MAENKTAKTPTDSGVGFIDGVWYGPGPTAWQCQCGKPYTVTCISSKPPKRQWVGLTEEEVMVAAYQAGFDIHEDYDNEDDPEKLYWWSADGEASNDSLLKLRDFIEAKLKEKNT